jgi:hypothetical protein
MNSSQQSGMVNIKSFILFLILFFSLSLPFSVEASLIAPAHIEWVQTNTKHFNIVHDRNQQDLGLYYAQIAELAYSNLSAIFTTLPEKITVVISDNTDMSNGNATVFPYPLINVYPVLVGQQDSLSEAGEWGKELLTHELTHVAQLYPYSSTGYVILRNIFGSIISPNLLMPSWWKEGMAVEIETQLSNQGRSRSYLQDAQVRSYVTKNRLKEFDLSQINESLVSWPYSNRQYFFGSMIMSQMAKEKKVEALGQLVSEQSYVLPYMVNSPMEETLNKDYSTIYSETLDAYQANSTKQITQLQTIPNSLITSINSDLLMSKSVQLNNNGSLLGFIATTDMKTELQIYRKIPNSNQFVQVELNHKPSGNIGFFSFHPLEAKVIFSKTHKVNLHQSFSDLYIYDIINDKVDDLTENERARDPVYSPDGNFVLFTHTANGLTELKELELSSKKIRTLVKTDRKNRINSYTYKNSHEVLYTCRTQTGDQQLWSLDTHLLNATSVSKPPKQIRFIKYKNEKLYFTSTENEVSNVYSAKISENKVVEVVPLTHLLTGALSFDVDEKEKQVFTTVIGDNGPYVASSAFIPEKTILPQIQNDILNRYRNYTDPSYSMTTTQSDYSALPYIYPHYWIPFISNNVTGNGVLYQALTSASDPLGMHSYAAQLNYDSFSNKIGFVATYMNTQLPWSWNLSALQTQQLFGIDSYVRKNTYSLTLFPDTFYLNEDIQLSFGAIVNQTEDQFATTNHAGGFIQASYADIEQRPNHYYPMSGLSLLGKYQRLADQSSQSKSIYGDYSQALFSLTSYNHLWLPRDHTIMAKLDALYTFEDVARRFGTSNLSLPTDAELQPLFMVRGYQAGQFSGTQMASFNFEYRFPIYDVLSGSGTTPFYIKYITGGVVADALAVKGFGYDADENFQALKLSEQIFSAGIEARMNTTVGYILPVNFIFGLYGPMSHRYAKDSLVTGLSIQLSGF